jgi:hypothetical protein
MLINVSGTRIECYDGCLTSSAIRIVGASSECHDGRQMQAFIVLVGLVAATALLFTALYRWALDRLKRVIGSLVALCSTAEPNSDSNLALR